LILPGHYASERPAVETLAVHLQQVFPAIHAFPSQSEQDPLMLVTAES
jgi:putative NIF3 family GTP cyclohydrolase 1 type 2